MRLRHLGDIARGFRVVSLDFGQVAGKQLSGDNAH